MRIIINADDFGLSSDINKAIVKAFKERLISSTTIMTNTHAFEEACEFVFQEDLLGKVGIHLNLSEGRPVTNVMAQSELFCDEEGLFKRRRPKLFYLSKNERDILRHELQAQIDILKQKNIFPTHLDSHHHYHTEWAVAQEIITVAKKNGIRRARLSRNIGKDLTFYKSLYKNIYNNHLKRKLAFNMDYFCSIDDFYTTDTKFSDMTIIEIMTHPGLNSENILIDLGSGYLLKFLRDKIKDKYPNAILSSFQYDE